MLSLILSVILGVIFTLVATQNPNLVAINFFGYSFNFPLYVIGALSFLAGLFVSLVFSIFSSTTKAIDMHRFDQLQKYVTSLEVENKNLKNQINELKLGIRSQKVETAKENIRGFFGRLRHNLST